MVDYTDVEHLLFRGFLTEHVEWEGVPIVIKSLNQEEYALSLLYAGDDDMWQAYYFIIFSIFLFNRQNVLGCREDFADKFIPILDRVPETFLHSIMSRIKVLNERAQKALEQIRGYSYGAESRQRWSLMQNNPPNAPTLTGVPYTDCLGINVHQKLWCHYNRNEDVSQVQDWQWGLTKFQASFQSNEVKKIDSEDKHKKREEIRRRTAVFHGYNPDVEQKGMFEEVRVSNESVEDLLDQMKRGMAGQKDFHDQVIEAHEERKKAQMQKAIAEREAKIKAAKQARAEILPSDTQEPLVVFSADDLERIKAERKAHKRSMLLAGKYGEEEELEAQKKHMEKWNSKPGKDSFNDQPQSKIPDHLKS
jgi:hypothetical protein